MKSGILWIRRCLAVLHLALGLVFLLSALSKAVLGVRGLPELALGAGMLVLARWLWSGHRWLRAALLVTHCFVLLLGSLFIKWGFDAIAAAERSTYRGGGLLGPAAFFPLLIGVPLLVFALCSIAAALWAIPRQWPESR